MSEGRATTGKSYDRAMTEYPAKRNKSLAIIAILPFVLLAGQAFTRLQPKVARTSPIPSPMLRARFGALLTMVDPDKHLPPFVFSREILYALRSSRHNESVWIADAHGEDARGIRIVLNADTGAVKQFSNGVWITAPHPITVPAIYSEARARSAARRFLICLGTPLSRESVLCVVSPEVMQPHPWGRWVITPQYSGKRWRLSLDAQTGELRDFQEDTIQ